MSFHDKCIESEEMGRIAYENAYYNSAINRYYYSFFQYLKQVLESKQIHTDEEKVNEGGSHEYTKNQYVQYIRKKGNTKNNMKKVRDINDCFSKMKQMRKIADYDEKSCEKEDADKVKRWYNLIISIIV